MLPGSTSGNRSSNPAPTTNRRPLITDVLVGISIAEYHALSARLPPHLNAAVHTAQPDDH